MADSSDSIHGGDLGIETKEVDGSVLTDAIQQAGREAGEASQEEIDQLMGSSMVEEVDHTREIDTREIRKKHQGS